MAHWLTRTGKLPSNQMSEALMRAARCPTTSADVIPSLSLGTRRVRTARTVQDTAHLAFRAAAELTSLGPLPMGRCSTKQSLSPLTVIGRCLIVYIREPAPYSAG